jgi:hypothetical protein
LIFIAADTLEEAAVKMNEDLVSLAVWLCHNKLKLNISKTKYMVISFRKNMQKELVLENLKIKIGEEELECVDSIKYLGVIIDEKLKFDKNILDIQKKVGKKINFIQRLGGELNKFSNITLYKSIILTHFVYCSSILFFANVYLIFLS